MADTSPAVTAHANTNKHRQRSVFTTPSYAGVDQGVDFTGTGAIPALAPATITDIGTAHIIEGATVPYVIYRANRGKHKGKYIYVMETFTVQVKVGDTVAAGQSIGYATGGGYGIEIGYNRGPKGLDPVATLYPNPHSPKAAGYSMLAWLKARGLKAGSIPATYKLPSLKELIAAVKSDLANYKNSDGTYGKNHKSATAIARFARSLIPKVKNGKLTVDQFDAKLAAFAGTPVSVSTPSYLGQAAHAVAAPFEAAAGAVESVGHFLGELSDPTTWLRGLYIVGGTVLILSGVFMVAKELGAPTPDIPIVKAAKFAATRGKAKS